MRKVCHDFNNILHNTKLYHPSRIRGRTSNHVILKTMVVYYQRGCHWREINQCFHGSACFTASKSREKVNYNNEQTIFLVFDDDFAFRRNQLFRNKLVKTKVTGQTLQINMERKYIDSNNFNALTDVKQENVKNLSNLKKSQTFLIIR